MAPLIAHLAIYEDASEALHGTYYGVLFHTGCYDPNNTQGWSEEENLIKQHRLLSSILCLFICSHIRDAVEVVAKMIELNSLPVRAENGLTSMREAVRVFYKSNSA